MMDVKTKAMSYIAVFVGILVLFTASAELYGEASSAGDGLNASNACENVGCFYNSSRTVDCTSNNVTTADTVPCGESGSDGIPLHSLFEAGGVVFVLVAAALLVFVVRKAWPK